MTPTVPTYRAPDYNVKKHVAIKHSETDNESYPSSPAYCPATSAKQHESKLQRGSKMEVHDTDDQLTSKSPGAEPSWIGQRSRAMITGTHDETSSASMPPTSPNQYATTLRSGVVPTMNGNVATRDASSGIISDAPAEPCLPFDSRSGQGRMAKDKDGDRKWHSGPRASPTRSNHPPKTHCNHWIQYGECAYGGRCRYKHEMPTLDVLKKVTGFTKVPQWYKEQTAIQNRGPTWVERNIEAKKNVGRGDDMDIPGPREFPDPSTLKFLQGETGGFTKQEEPGNRVAPSPVNITPPVGFIVPAAPASGVAQNFTSAITPAVNEKNRGSLTVLRRNSQISSSSGTTSSFQTISRRCNLNHSLGKAQQKPASLRKRGLSASIHAPGNELIILDPCRNPENPRSRHHIKSSAREKGHSKANVGTGQRTAAEMSLI